MLPDTQYYACGYPEIFRSQADWIVEQVDSAGIGMVLHTGDIVDRNRREQWDVAADALHRLDGRVPYLLAPGNHDLDADRQSLLDDYFGSADLSMDGCTTFGAKDRGHVGNAYAVVELRGSPWLFVSLEFGPRDATLDWAGRILREHADLPAVLLTHAYLYAEDERYDRAVLPLQPYHPDGYSFTADQGVADGQDIWETLVEPNENVRVVLSGHVIPIGTARSAAMRQTGSVVHEVLTNFQHCGACPCEEVEGGGGYLRIFELAEDHGSLRVTTFSPHHQRFLSDDDNEFELAL